jgi:PKD repeat protein
MIPPNALVGENGVRGGMVGIAPVSPDRLPEPLPPGLTHVLDISIQTDGPQNFDRPVPVRFPNLPDPVTGKKLAPGEKTGLWSFSHDLGRWEVVGSMTVTADGNFIETDQGVGVRQPGWHSWNVGVPGCCPPIGGPAPGGNCQTNCLADTSISGGTVHTSPLSLCVGGTITFEAKGITVHPGTIQVVCKDSSGNVTSDTITATAGAPVEYEWEVRNGGTVVASGKGQSATVTASNAGAYTCVFTVKVNDECPSSPKTLNSQPVEVSGLQSVDAQANGFSNQSSQCQNTPVSFSAQVQQINCGRLTYSWNFDDGSPPDTSSNPTHPFPGFGDYTVTLTVSCTGPTCTDTKSDSVAVHIGAVQSVEAKANGQDSTTVFVGQSVSFSATTTPPNYTGVDFDWDFGDGTTAQGRSASHTYQDDGTYTAKVTVSCTGGSSAPKTDSVTVTVKDCSVSIVGADSGNCGSTLTLGSSVDPQGGTYGWSIVGPGAEFVDPPGRNGPGVKLNLLTPGQVTVYLTYRPPGVTKATGDCVADHPITVKGLPAGIAIRVSLDSSTPGPFFKIHPDLTTDPVRAKAEIIMRDGSIHRGLTDGARFVWEHELDGEFRDAGVYPKPPPKPVAQTCSWNYTSPPSAALRSDQAYSVEPMDSMGNRVVRGGRLILRVRATICGVEITGHLPHPSDPQPRFVVGENPGRQKVFEYLREVKTLFPNLNGFPDAYLESLAAVESGGRLSQFTADGFPYFNGYKPDPTLDQTDGGVGIMQITQKTPDGCPKDLDSVWNWKSNILRGVTILSEKMSMVQTYHSAVNNSPALSNLLLDYNLAKRGPEGKKFVTKVSIKQLNTSQANLDALRGYNGWARTGSDPDFKDVTEGGAKGLLHEYRVKREGGRGGILVVSVNENTLIGELEWERIPIEERTVKPSDPYIPGIPFAQGEYARNYVNHVIIP